MTTRRKGVPSAKDLKRAGEYGYEPVVTRGQYEELALIRSKRDPSKTWKIHQHKETGAFKCSCPAFVFKGERDADGAKTCKHLNESRENARRLGMGLRDYFTSQGVDAGGDVVTAGAMLAQTAAAEHAARIERLLLEAADAVSNIPNGTLRSVLYERQWKALAEALAPRLGALGPANAPPVALAPKPGARRLRLIELD